MTKAQDNHADQLEDPSDLRNQHERFVRDAIARSLITLPFATHDSRDPHGAVYGFYKQLLASASTGELPSARLIAQIIDLIAKDVAINKAAGNHLKAEIEQRWCEGFRLHFTFGQGLVTP